MKTISCDICGKTVEPNKKREIKVFSFDQSHEDLRLETCPSCAETISQAIADELKGIKERVADTLKTNE